MKKLLSILFFAMISLASYSQVLMIMGGENHDVFLGCLNTPSYDSKSIWNRYGYGNKYDSDCIWNKYGDYGNKHSSLSPWNKYSSSCPIIVDSAGRSYGFFNEYNSNKIVKKICILAKAVLEGDIELDEAYMVLFE